MLRILTFRPAEYLKINTLQVITNDGNWHDTKYVYHLNNVPVIRNSVLKHYILLPELNNIIKYRIICLHIFLFVLGFQTDTFILIA